MKTYKQLEVYTAASKAVADFRKKNAKVFDQMDALLIDQQEKETELKTFVRENVQRDISNDHIKVVYSQPFSKYYDAGVVLDMVKPKERKALIEAKAIVTQIDKKKFEDLVDKGEIPVEIKQEAFREEAGTARISIKEV